MKTFKKYKNRKIYSMDTHGYVTLQDLIETSLVSEVLVIDSASGADITKDTLLSGLGKALSDEEKSKVLTFTKELMYGNRQKDLYGAT